MNHLSEPLLGEVLSFLEPRDIVPECLLLNKHIHKSCTAGTSLRSFIRSYTKLTCRGADQDLHLLQQMLRGSTRTLKLLGFERTQDQACNHLFHPWVLSSHRFASGASEVCAVLADSQPVWRCLEAQKQAVLDRSRQLFPEKTRMLSELLRILVCNRVNPNALVQLKKWVSIGLHNASQALLSLDELLQTSSRIEAINVKAAESSNLFFMLDTVQLQRPSRGIGEVLIFVSDTYIEQHSPEFQSQAKDLLQGEKFCSGHHSNEFVTYKLFQPPHQGLRLLVWAKFKQLTRELEVKLSHPAFGKFIYMQLVPAKSSLGRGMEAKALLVRGRYLELRAPDN